MCIRETNVRAVGGAHVERPIGAVLVRLHRELEQSEDDFRTRRPLRKTWTEPTSVHGNVVGLVKFCVVDVLGPVDGATEVNDRRDVWLSAEDDRDKELVLLQQWPDCLRFR